jgi:dynein intermediate chain, cytosolic
LFKEFNDEKLKNRIITSLDWNNQNDEHIIASYESINSNLNNSLYTKNNDFDDGLALIWNLNSNKNIPEYTLNSSSWITSVCFNQFHTNLIIGATYSGQICIWDTRSNKHTPIQRTPFSVSSHTNPIYCLKLIGSSNSNSLISLSNDGRMCLWNTCNMNQPIETIDLQIKQSSNIPILCFDSNLQDNFIVGTEDSLIYSLNNKNTLNNKYYLNDTFESHYGPVCSLSCNKAKSDFSNLFLSSSFDWTIKLWDANVSRSQQKKKRKESP